MTRPIRLNENEYALTVEGTADTTVGGGPNAYIATASVGARVCVDVYHPATSNASGEFSGIGGNFCYGLARDAQGRTIQSASTLFSFSTHDRRLQIPIGLVLRFREQSDSALEVNAGFRHLSDGDSGVLRAPSIHPMWGLELGLGVSFMDCPGEVYLRLGISTGFEFDL